MDYMKDELILCTNTSEEVVGVILMQEDHVVAYELRKLKFNEHNYPTHEKKFLAIIHVLKFKTTIFWEGILIFKQTMPTKILDHTTNIEL
jgi:hypothetical protein